MAEKVAYGIPVPRGVQKDWWSRETARNSRGALLRGRGVSLEWGEPTACVEWFDRFNRRRLIAAHYANGRSATVRIDANGISKTTFGQVPAPVGRSGEASETRSGSTEGEHAVPCEDTAGAQSEGRPK